MTAPFTLIVRALAGHALPHPAGPLPRRIVCRIVAEELADLHPLEIANAVGITREAARLRLERAHLTGRFDDLLRPVGQASTTTTAGATPATFPTIPAGAAAEIGQPDRATE